MSDIRLRSLDLTPADLRQCAGLLEAQEATRLPVLMEEEDMADYLAEEQGLVDLSRKLGGEVR